MSFSSFISFFPAFRFGDAGSNVLTGSWRNDRIYGFGGDDAISGMEGNDIISAGQGNDIIDGGAGSDTIDGGGGFDIAYYSGHVADYTIALGRQPFLFARRYIVTDLANGDQDTLQNVEALRFDADDYTLYLDGRNNAVLARDDVGATGEDSALTIQAATLLANDWDYEGDKLSVTAVSSQSAAGAAVTLVGGVVTYNPGNVFQYLNVGQTATDTFTYTVDDGKGGIDTATVTVTVHGANDAAVVTGDLAGTVTEASPVNPGTPSASGQLTSNDVDNGSGFQAVAGRASAAGYGAYSITADGKWTYTLDNANAAVDALDDGESLTDTFTVLTEDGTAQQITVTINGVDDAVAPQIAPRINEVHYDNAGTDTGEFIEIRVAAGESVSNLTIELYNGNDGKVYDSASVASLTKTTDGTYDYYVWSLPANGIQNGSPDGFALSRGNQVIEFLSYEGSFKAVNGIANGLTSIDIGVEEASNTPVGQSLQRTGDGPTDWTGPTESTKGTSNDGVAPQIAPRINEVHYDNAGSDTGEFIEIRVAAGESVSDLTVELYNGANGRVYGSTSVAALTKTTDGTYDYYVWSLPADGIQNGSPDGFALSRGGKVIEFLSYEGTLTATDGTANGQTSTDIGVQEGSSTPVGQSLQRTGDGPTDWTGPKEATKGAANDGNGGEPNPGEPQSLLISQIQGTATASTYEGKYVLVSAIVTYTTGDGFFLQEEDSDADADVRTSEGIFVYTGSASGVAVGDHIDVSGTVAEYYNLTQIKDVTKIVTLSQHNAQPTPAVIELSPDFVADLEQYEGMAVTLKTGTSEPLTIIENYDFDRYGEIVVSAGGQVQPTQIYDPNTQLDEIKALQQDNANNRFKIDDGNSAQNPTHFPYAPASTGDNGNGYIDAGDTFTENGPTLRVGAELTGSVSGVLTYSFDEFKLLVNGTLPIDEATNGGAREQTPEDVGGRLTVSSFNLLNFFTTLNNGSGNGSGPNNLTPRGATTEGDLQRQLDKIVEAMLKIDASVFGLQELENNGFDSDSAIVALVNGLNAKAPAGTTYAFVNPTAQGSDGFIGTDAITTGLIYKTNEVSVVASDIYTFDEGGQQSTRPAVTATFEEVGTGEQFTVAVNHFKSKSGTGTGADADKGDGQGAFNATRTETAHQLAEWLDITNPDGYFAKHGIVDPDALIIGDLNSYAKEDPVTALRNAGFTDLIDAFIGQDQAFSYLFNGQRGTLDQGLANSSLAGQVTGVTEWHINAQEPDLLSYSSQYKDPRFYNDDVFATSDHDPLLIGLDLSAQSVFYA
ncbi:VCBS repeat-containing protein [Pseudochelatococcus lubricantis]|uniref:VCBS repeat-containing protein n=1 Tax=Pseudochelatococcus lubricantis TaxID=1538102 RepID=A0ABX0UZF9_9HYPH|nr:ExeM/NucH family extracellular endonuclease [Pseudochelatococcus lubricantis]NIJ58339.1 VCBS repeat-containing protein [Pseudochelatococcus lubricantis]